MYMKLKDGKGKVLTLSYDDGTIQDIRLMKILDKHGIKSTFNINTGMYFPEDGQSKEKRRLKLSEAKELYINSGHEVAVHAHNHSFLKELSADEIMIEILENRKAIESQYGTFARGMSYPYNSYNDKVVNVVGNCGICYSRTVESSMKFDFPENWLTLHPTCHHHEAPLMDLAKKFVEEDYPNINPYNWMFYVWGHSYDFDLEDNWEVIEKFSEYIGGRDDIWYATNIEIYDYAKAYEALQTSVDKTVVYNPTTIDVWFMEKGKIYCVHGGETLHL